ncbi:MAG TPA: DUF305 domain-containing protein [Vicinamibacterales bacterium]
MSRLAAAACLLFAAFGAGCGSAPAPKPQTNPTPPPKASSAAPAAEASQIHQTPPSLGRYPYSDADVAFMSGMIPHHAQAVIMAGWAPTHGARRDVAVLCERIVVGQRDEIHLMQQWLRDRSLPVPSETDTRMHMKMDGMDHAMLMPGMLTDEEMAALDRARGSEFDRLFLEGMIRHHQGAIDMVTTLFNSYGAAQDEVIFKFANDVYVDQMTEITRMKEMLAETPNGGSLN